MTIEAGDSASTSTPVVEGSQGATQVSGEAVKSEPKSEQPTKHKVKIDGQEAEVSLDELIAGYSKAKASHDRFQQAAQERKIAEQLKKEAEEAKARLKTNPWDVLKELEADPRALAEEYLIKQLEYDAMTPEQRTAMEESKRKDRERQELEEKIRKYEEREKAEKEAQEAKEIQEKTQHFVKEIETSMLEALQSSALPKTHAMVAKVADKMLEAHSYGIDMHPSQAVRLVEEELKVLKKAFLEDLDADKLADFLGEEQLKKIRKRDVEKLKNPIPTPENKNKARQHQDEQPPTDSRDWVDWIRKKNGLK